MVGVVGVVAMPCMARSNAARNRFVRSMLGSLSQAATAPKSKYSKLQAICAADCAGDWYAIGQRDGRLGATPQADIYASRCGGNVDRARYQEGWQSGDAMRPKTPYY